MIKKRLNDVARDMDKVPINVGDLVCPSWDYPKGKVLNNQPLYLVVNVSMYKNRDGDYRFFKLICFPRRGRNELREFFANEVYFVQSL